MRACVRVAKPVFSRHSSLLTRLFDLCSSSLISPHLFKVLNLLKERRDREERERREERREERRDREERQRREERRDREERETRRAEEHTSELQSR